MTPASAGIAYRIRLPTTGRSPQARPSPTALQLMMYFSPLLAIVHLSVLPMKNGWKVESPTTGSETSRPRMRQAMTWRSRELVIRQSTLSAFIGSTKMEMLTLPKRLVMMLILVEQNYARSSPKKHTKHSKSMLMPPMRLWMETKKMKRQKTGPPRPRLTPPPSLPPSTLSCSERCERPGRMTLISFTKRLFL